jgi:hypothetical protein
MVRFLVPTLAMFPLLGGFPTDATTTATSRTPLINQTETRTIVKIAEGCGIGYFRDGYGHCQYYGYGAPAAPPHEACPPDRHFVHWANHRGGFCKSDYAN